MKSASSEPVSAEQMEECIRESKAVSTTKITIQRTKSLVFLSICLHIHDEIFLKKNNYVEFEYTEQFWRVSFCHF